MTEAILVKLVEKRLQAWADAQDIRIAFEDVAFDPPAEAIYARVDHLPATTTGAFLEGGHRTLIGLYQIGIVAPAGNGLGEARRIALSLSDKFPANLVLVDAAFSVRITSPVSIGPKLPEPRTSQSSNSARTILPCSFNYRADIVS
jgi:hypothetical protein